MNKSLVLCFAIAIAMSSPLTAEQRAKTYEVVVRFEKAFPIRYCIEARDNRTSVQRRIERQYPNARKVEVREVGASASGATC